MTLSGAVEIAPRLGTRGPRLRPGVDRLDAAGQSPARGGDRAGKPGDADPHAGRAAGGKQEWLDRLLLRIDGVQQVQESKYIMLHAPRSALPEIRRCCPAANRRRSFRSKVASDKVAVHAVCRENVFWETLESLKAAGASALLVLPVEKMLA